MVNINIKKRKKLIGMLVLFLLFSVHLISIFASPYPIEGKISIIHIENHAIETGTMLNVTVTFDISITNTGFYKVRSFDCQSPTLGKYNINIITENGSFNDYSYRLLLSCGYNFPKIVAPGEIIDEIRSMKFSFSIGVFKFRLSYGGLEGLETTKDTTLIIISLTPFDYSINS